MLILLLSQRKQIMNINMQQNYVKCSELKAYRDKELGKRLELSIESLNIYLERLD